MKARICISLIGAILLILSLAFSQQTNKAEILYQEALMQMEGKGNYSKALEIFGQVIKDFPGNRQTCARSQFQIGVCNEKLGNAEARKAYERVVRDYADQAEVVAQARSRLLALENATQSKKAPELSVRRVWTGLGVDIEGGISQDGRYLSFTDWSTGDLAVRDMTSGEIRRLTHKGSWSSSESADFSSVSRDGKQVAYAWFDKDGNCSLRCVRIDGSEPRILSSANSYLIPEAWTSDGKYILTIIWSRTTREIALISTSDSSVRVLKSFSRGGPLKVAISPDDRWIAYDYPQREKSSERDIFLLAVDGNREIRLVEHPSNDFMPVWAPDGKSLLFASDRGGTPGFWSIAVLDGQAQGTPWLVKSDIGYPRLFGIAANGILYYGLHLGDDIYTANIDPSNGELQSAPVSVSKRFIGFNSTPACSPDGQSLAYISHRGGIMDQLAPANRIIVVRSLKTGEEHELRVSFGPGFEIAWAPDSRSFMVVGFYRDSLSRASLFQVDAKTGESKVLIDRIGTTNSGSASKGWFPDGKSIYFTRRGIVRLDLESGEQQTLFTWKPDEFNFYFATPSPDGNQFAAWRRNLKTGFLSIVLIPVSGGESRELYSMEEDTPRDWSPTPGGISWTLDGKYILFAKRTEAENKMDLWRVDVVGGRTERLGSLSHKIHDLVVHPDGKRIFFYGREKVGDVWAMENFLPKEVPERKEFSIRKVSDALTEGAISPDGRYLSYMDGETGDLAIYEIATGKKNRLTTNNGSWDEFAESSRWSPDSKEIVYAWWNRNGFIELRIIGLDGSKPRILYSNKETIWSETYGWSPDGKQILACLFGNLLKNDVQYQIVLVSTADGSVRVLKRLENGWPSNMNFSPDGRYIVYDFQQKEDSPERDISILSTDESREIPLVEHPADDKVLGWAPDGKNILFASDRRNSLDAWVIQFSDGKVQGTPKLVTSNIGQKCYSMGFTQKGSFCYGIVDPAYDIYFAELDPETGKMLAPPKKLSTRFEGSLHQPEYSPDGKYIAYISEHPIALDIQSLETGKMREFSSKLLRNMASPRWSPDGRSILVGGWNWKGRKGIWRIDTQSGIFTLMVPPASDTESFYFLTTHGWSRDGKAIFLGRVANMQTQIMLREIESGTEKELYRGSGNLSLSCSPDGKWLAIINMWSGGVLRIMPAAGGEPRELYRYTEENNLVGIRWTPDGKYILFEKKQAEEKKYSWWRIPMGGGEPQKSGLEWDSAFFPDFHPDGRHIVFSTQGSKSENAGNWVMEDFLPKEVGEK